MRNNTITGRLYRDEPAILVMPDTLCLAFCWPYEIISSLMSLCILCTLHA